MVLVSLFLVSKLILYSDFFEYSIENDEVVEIARDSHRMGGPEGGFTQRSTIGIDN